MDPSLDHFLHWAPSENNSELRRTVRKSDTSPPCTPSVQSARSHLVDRPVMSAEENGAHSSGVSLWLHAPSSLPFPTACLNSSPVDSSSDSELTSFDQRAQSGVLRFVLLHIAVLSWPSTTAHMQSARSLPLELLEGLLDTEAINPGRSRYGVK